MDRGADLRTWVYCCSEKMTLVTAFFLSCFNFVAFSVVKLGTSK